MITIAYIMSYTTLSIHEKIGKENQKLLSKILSVMRSAEAVQLFSGKVADGKRLLQQFVVVKSHGYRVFQLGLRFFHVVVFSQIRALDQYEDDPKDNFHALAEEAIPDPIQSPARQAVRSREQCQKPRRQKMHLHLGREAIADFVQFTELHNNPAVRAKLYYHNCC